MKPRPEAEISQLKGVGPKLTQTLARLGIFRFIDLFLHLPFRYQDRTRVTPIRALRAGQAYLVEGRVTGCVIVYGKRRSLKVSIADDTGSTTLRFFHFSKFQQTALGNAQYLRAFGEFRFFGRELTCAHPEYETFDTPPSPPTPELTPIYPTTAGLGQGRVRQLVASLCALDWPEEDGTPYALLKFLHQPPADATPETIAAAQEAVARDELTAFYLVMKGRALRRRTNLAIGLPRAGGLGRQLLDKLGFRLTLAQARVVGEILTDLEGTTPMLRLVQGDVGSGKTIVAAFAAIRAAEHDCQTALMAPTELLAEQHAINFRQWLEPLGITSTLLTGQQSAAQRKRALEAIASGQCAVVIGTHALFQAGVEFNRLALSVIDEQHRFGVHQRMALQHKGDLQPHQLVMTATPIPRTLTMALYADMAVSVIDELPAGRQPITTHTVEQGKRAQVVARVRAVMDAGQQVYWVCTLIDDSDEIDAMSATRLFDQLRDALPDVELGLLHGRMTSEAKVTTMQAFKRGDIQLLVATTVVEVGVDVANATHMVIENAERLGLAQLHQLRGRVGRGDLPSHCFLLFTPGLSEAAKTRLLALRESQDGFYLAEQDLALRGPGDILGTRQSGEQTFRVADLGTHAHLMSEVMRRGDALIAALPESADADTMRRLLTTWAPAESGSMSV